MKTHMNRLRKEEGVNEDDLRYSAKKYEEHKRTLALEGKHLPTGEAVLIWDETKVSFQQSAHIIYPNCKHFV